MIATADIGGGHYDNKRSFLIYSDGSAADIEQGELMEEGIADVSLGAITDIQTPAGPVNVVGLLMQLYDGSDVGEWDWNSASLSTASNRPEADIDIRPFAVYRAEIASVVTQELVCSAASADCTPGTAVGAADVLGGCYAYDSTINELRFVFDNDATQGFTFTTAAVAAWLGTNTQYIIPQRLYGSKTNQGMTVSGQNILVEGNETVRWAKTLDHFITYDGQNEQVRLNPGVHDAQTYTNPKFFIDIIILDHAFNESGV